MNNNRSRKRTVYTQKRIRKIRMQRIAVVVIELVVIAFLCIAAMKMKEMGTLSKVSVIYNGGTTMINR